jgi:hypothetical protein
MCALPFHHDRTMASAAASASTSGIGSGSPTYGRDVSETVHRRHRPSSRCHHGQRLADHPMRPNVDMPDPQAEQRNPPQTSGNGVSAA